MVLVPKNTLERLKQHQQILTPPVTQSLKNLDSEMTDILSSKQLDDEEKAKLYYQVLQRFLTYYDQQKGQPPQVKLLSQKRRAKKLVKYPPKQKLLHQRLNKKWSKVYASSTSQGQDNCSIKLKKIGICCIGT